MNYLLVCYDLTSTNTTNKLQFFASALYSWKIPDRPRPNSAVGLRNCYYDHWRSQDLSGGSKCRGSGGQKSPSGFQGRSPGGGLGAKPPDADDFTMKK